MFLASAGAGLEVAHRGVHPGEEIELADGVVLRAIATPGHTPDHLAYLIVEDGRPAALFAGGSLMVGAVGRTDLLGAGRRRPRPPTVPALRNEILTLPNDLPVYPTHGAGSFCSAPTRSSRTTTIGQERATNPLLGRRRGRIRRTARRRAGHVPVVLRRAARTEPARAAPLPGCPCCARLDVDTRQPAPDGGRSHRCPSDHGVRRRARPPGRSRSRRARSLPTGWAGSSTSTGR